MKLSAECITYHLAKKYPVRLFSSNVEDVYGPPVIYQEGIDYSGNMVIISTPALEIIRRIMSETKFGLVILLSSSCSLTSRKVSSPVLWIRSDDTSVTEIYNQIKKVFEMFDSWDKEMTQIVFDTNAKKNRYQALAGSCETFFDVPLAIIRSSNQYVAFSDRYYKEYVLPNGVAKTNTVPWKYVNDTTMRKEWKNITLQKNIFSLEFGDSDCRIIGKNLFHNGNNVGHIGIVVDDPDGFSYYSFVLNHLHYYVQNLYNQVGAFSLEESDNNRYTELIRHTLDGQKISTEIWNHTFAQIGWMSKDPLIVTAFQVNEAYNSPRLDNELYAKNLESELQMKWNGIVPFQEQQRLYLVTNLDHFISGDNTDYQSALSVFIRDNLIYAGLSRIFYNIWEFEEAMKQAAIAVDYGTRYNSSRWCHEYNTYALPYLRQNAVGRLKKESVCSEKILKLIQYDIKKNTEYYKTLLTFFQCRFNSSDTAKALFIQRSTFQYRMSRIKKLTGLDLTSFQEISYCFLTFELLEHSESLL